VPSLNTIEYVETVVEDLATLRAHDRKYLLDRIEAQLTHAVPPWEHLEPIWELRVGEYRVFYDVDEAAAVVKVCAIRHRPPHKTTEEIL
jgi:mRNA-degrading endonuclease RelE of RelBE toxin-antitoxin system